MTAMVQSGSPTDPTYLDPRKTGGDQLPIRAPSIGFVISHGRKLARQRSRVHEQPHRLASNAQQRGQEPDFRERGQGRASGSRACACARLTTADTTSADTGSAAIRGASSAPPAPADTPPIQRLEPDADGATSSNTAPGRRAALSRRANARDAHDGERPDHHAAHGGVHRSRDAAPGAALFHSGHDRALGALKWQCSPTTIRIGPKTSKITPTPSNPPACAGFKWERPLWRILDTPNSGEPVQHRQERRDASGRCRHRPSPPRRPRIRQAGGRHGLDRPDAPGTCAQRRRGGALRGHAPEQRRPRYRGSSQSDFRPDRGDHEQGCGSQARGVAADTREPVPGRCG